MGETGRLMKHGVDWEAGFCLAYSSRTRVRAALAILKESYEAHACSCYIAMI